MKQTVENSIVGRIPLRGIALSAALLTVSACNLNTQTNAMEGIGFREARFQEISAMREYRQCRDDGVELDTKARSSGSAGQYLASARLLEKCETELGQEAANLAVDERMRAYALGIQNYIKGGNLETAARNLERFKKAFTGKDLYFTSGASFIETMESILGQKRPHEFGDLAALNVSYELKNEMRRIRYWKRN
ncbi:MAG: hypothetical protein V1253_00855 [Alphaproteobacteria bacterium]|jgi:hypothetical protein|nr:hypothetical protein [Alphaproteobacteria bacterium]HIJ44101.1 hypothetical protein [Rhodospirillaceae bacterium]HJP53198.1 hypothetical protein [Rhodospirillales bacterium]MEE1561747.1 hypothetical protein [Alphaproteobacteria bacterium]MEE1568371.1 hypothetical protein [Alphaproteobacteria bacterium]